MSKASASKDSYKDDRRVFLETIVVNIRTNSQADKSQNKDSGSKTPRLSIESSISLKTIHDEDGGFNEYALDSDEEILNEEERLYQKQISMLFLGRSTKNLLV